MTYNDSIEICKQLDIEYVPLIYQGSFKDLNKIFPTFTQAIELNEQNKKLYFKDICKSFLEISNMREYTDNYPAEGIVIKTDNANTKNRISCKVISNNFLLKYNL